MVADPPRRIGGVILAAGRSSRMGRPKALLPIGDETWLERLARVFREADLAPVVVVAGGEVEGYVHLCLRDTACVVGDPDAPMIDSLARALVLPALETAEAAIVQPVDAPFTSPSMIAALTSGFSGPSRVLSFDGCAGHPVLVGRAHFDAIRRRPEGGLRTLLSPGALGVQHVDFRDRRILADLDSPSDLPSWQDLVRHA